MKTLSWLRVEVKACRISWSELEKEWNLQRWSTKKLHNLGLFFFGLGVFKRFNTLFWKHTCYDLWVFQNIQDKPRNFSQVFTKAFPQPPCFFFFRKRSLIYRQTFWSGWWDTMPIAWTSSRTSVKSNLLQITSTINAFLLLSNNVVQPLDMSQKCSFFKWPLLVKSQCTSLHDDCFD